MSDTKHQIMETAVRLFNESGFKNIALSQIASELGISKGNITYHFNKKDDLMLGIVRAMDEELEVVIRRSKSFPSLNDIIEQTNIFYHFQLKYKFFYLDILEILRDYPEIAEAHKEYSLSSIQHIRASFDYCVGRGVFLPEPFPGAYDNLAHTAWMKGAFWLVQMEVLQKDCKDIETFTNSMASLWYPFLTEEGWKEIKASGKTALESTSSAKE
ncbi:MAG: TetR/AcrR family transcriptional regulator [Lewinellaceae bacterium]|nr:TetR/AcrR family transcriptional regulator [Lewinellaceae bacterium]